MTTRGRRWPLVPDVPVFVDSRIEVPPASAWDDYLAISAAHAGWSERLDAWQVSIVAASRADQPALIDALSRDPAWREVHADADGAVFVRAGQAG